MPQGQTVMTLMPSEFSDRLELSNRRKYWRQIMRHNDNVDYGPKIFLSHIRRTLNTAYPLV